MDELSDTLDVDAEHRQDTNLPAQRIREGRELLNDPIRLFVKEGDLSSASSAVGSSALMEDDPPKPSTLTGSADSRNGAIQLLLKPTNRTSSFSQLTKDALFFSGSSLSDGVEASIAEETTSDAPTSTEPPLPFVAREV
eukprot:CAMPEP_0194037678 /NCGR_PEP_ID=MMETSP0009_2-20130614/10011_1 /TAXON_ID=210454 /ORGANISM="Grammatophora oceanica, Strain CCMP 410" /LENGTH=138 /DNA_ID=CAMNT_0038679931 /DNA_START=127 /DNA_END=545 /DNA_ORIENTATION=-